TYEQVEPVQTPIEIQDPWWYEIHMVKTKDGYCGQIQLDVQFQTTCLKTNKTNQFKNDNLWSSSHRPFNITIASEPLPSLNNWHHGDLHFHSAITNDQVEYGAPLVPTARMAKALGLNFMAVTDHSYDLDDHEDNYLKNNPELPKWKTMHQETENIEKETGLIMIPGEEVSCGNHRDENVHLLLLNNREYFPGAGDSNERWFVNNPDLNIREILDKIDQATLAFAAHPGVPFAPLQRILLKRGVWNDKDYNHPRLNGMQIYNGCHDRAFQRGRQIWIRQLLQGKRLILIAGNDAHGNFNRHRKLGQPFLYISESEEHTFGRGRTLLHLPSGINRDQIITAIKQGKACITTGPVLDILLKHQKGTSAGIGASISGEQFKIEIRGKSTSEFGQLIKCHIYMGNLNTKKESLWKKINHFTDVYQFSETVNISIQHSAYLRAELHSKNASSKFFCMTNPIWIE
ncbi:CehA/McbA family metallohydrolase, partial [bacterium]